MEKSSKLIGLKAANDIPALLAYWDKNEICRFANSTYLDWYGKSQEEMINKMSKKELLGEKYKEHSHYIKEVLKGNLQSFDLEISTPKGELRHSHATYTPDIENGKVIGFTAHITNITTRKNLEASYIKSEKLLKNLLESAPDAIVIVDSTGTIQIVNHQAENIFGYSKPEMIGEEIELLIPGGHKSKHKTHIKKYFDSASIRQMGDGIKLYGKRKNGEKFRVEVSLSPTQTDDGILVMAAVRDITDRVRMETELEESYKRNSIFIQQAPNAIAMFDMDMRYMAASHKWIEDYNLKGREIIGHSHYEIFPEIGDEWKQKHQRCLRGEINQCDEAPFDREDGTRQWLTWDVRPWYKSEGVIGGLLIYTADITDIKEKDQEKTRIEEILERTNSVARIGTWELQINEGKVIWSKITREIHEVSEDFEPDLATGINFYKEGYSRDTITKLVTDSISNNTSYDVEIELITAKGNETWVRVIGQSEFVDGKCKRHYGVFQDITPIKNTELKINRVNNELRAILNSASVSIIGTDKKGLITHFNKGAEQMLQYSRSELVEKHTPAIFHVKEEIIKRGEELSAQMGYEVEGFDVFVQSTIHKEEDTREWTYVRKDGTKLIVLLVLTAIKDHLGNIFGFLGIATDITERVENQQKLKEAKEDLEVLTEKLTSQNMQLANFAHITSHNLRAPVSNLNALLQFYHSSEDQEMKEEIIGNFEVVSNHLTQTLDTLVDLLKIQDEGSKELEILYFDEIFEKTKEMLVGHIMESDAQVTADFSKAPKITYNRVFLESIFLNLIGNAIKYRSPDRPPVIKLETDLKYNRIVFTISDNGLGIDLKSHSKELFGLHKTFHKHAESKGIGLFLTKKHIEAMGGIITARSEVGKGTTFTIEF
ncbi:PAS domain S-box protein [Cyclobacterium amurskyense]|uniref:histidine kinase n=1 Tax=Cyclobacterium amurskyense TaxID=320787 RepID=A0A0H4PCL7_9BACT|nr:PAS domain S-box protein [Cyclobacterium amurskyense]AKP50553.1 Histidine kinase sensor protein [Cyclobacterium amurskyense]